MRAITSFKDTACSPAPWSISNANNYWIQDVNGKMVCDGLTYRGDTASADIEEHANAKMIESVPILYDAAYNMCYREGWRNCSHCDDYPDCHNCPYKELRRALEIANLKGENE